MLKKILCVVLSLLMLVTFATACKKKDKKITSSKKKPSSSAVEDVSSAASSEIAQTDSEEEDDDSSYFPYKWTLKTKSAFFRDTEEAKVSATVSKEIKHYSNPGVVQIQSYHLNMGWTMARGTDFESRKDEFGAIVNAKYFNSYILSMGATYLLTELEFISENGGTFWFQAPKLKNMSDIAPYIESVDTYVQMLKSNGYWDIFNGFHWDEPIWGGVPNNVYLALTKALYQKYGKRNYPVFACGEFTDFEGNSQQLGFDADSMRKVLPEACKYVTDAGYDSYSVDVREGAVNGNFINKNHAIYPEIVDGKTYYTGMKNVLKKHIGHPVNFWYYPCAYTTYLWGGLDGIMYADEEYCLAHLNLMAEDVLKEEYAGGVCIYTFPTFHETDYGFEHRMSLKDSNGNYYIVAEGVDKWEKFSKRLQEICKVFNNTKAKVAKIS